MKVNVFLFYYTYDNSKILVLSCKNDVLELPSIDLVALTDNKLDCLDKIISEHTTKLGLNFDLKFKHIDTIYDILDDSRCLSLYYCAYAPKDRLSRLENNNYYLEDISGYNHNNLIRKFLCVI